MATPDHNADTVVPAQSLGTFEGEDVLNASVAIKNAGDGLSKALDVHPTLLHRGDKVFVVLECDVTKISFPGIKGTNAVSRVADLTTVTATLVGEDLVKASLDETQRKIEEKAGVHRLPLGATDEDPPDEVEEG